MQNLTAFNSIVWRGFVVASLLFLGLTTPTCAETATWQGKATVVCNGSKPTPVESADAKARAKLDVLARYIAGADTARQKNIAQVRQTLEQKIDLYLSGVTELHNATENKSRVLTIVIEATVNISAIDLEIRKVVNSGAAPSANPSADKAAIAFVFVSRRQAAVTEKGPKSAERNTDFKVTEDTKQQKVGVGEIGLGTLSKTETAKVSETSVTRTADTVVYDVAPAEGIDTAMSGVLGTAGFDVVPTSELLDAVGGTFDNKRLIEDYRTGDDLSQETRKMATDRCRKLEVPFLAFGTLTLRLKERDAATGQIVVGVIVHGQVWDLRKKFAIKAASVGPVQYQALGGSQTEAEQQALKGASEMVAKLLADQLLARGIR